MSINMQPLSKETILKLSLRPNVRADAVINILSTVHHNINEHIARMNFLTDKWLYEWNNETCAAIREGIDLSAGRRPSPYTAPPQYTPDKVTRLLAELAIEKIRKTLDDYDDARVS